MAPKKDYYELLGVPKDASQDDIKKAFRKLAFQYHPDHNHHDGASDRFKEINEAYQVLSDAQKRANYDHFGHMGTGRGFEGFDDFFGLGDIFDAFFSGATEARRRAPQPGADLHYQVDSPSRKQLSEPKNRSTSSEPDTAPAVKGRVVSQERRR